jgi:hypothetical protein
MDMAWEERDHTDDLNVDNTIILKLILKGEMRGVDRNCVVQNMDHHSPLSKGLFICLFVCLFSWRYNPLCV